MIKKIKRAIERPDLIQPYLLGRYDSYIYRPIKGAYIDWTAPDDGEYIVELDGYNLTVDLNDGGIGRDLALYGIREPISYEFYRRKLRELSGSSEDPIHILEAGANIGYYALAPAVDIDHSVVHAVEVDKHNVDRLIKNTQINGVEEKFNIDCVALGSENTEADLYKSGHSNLHSLQEEFVQDRPSLHTETESTTVTTGASWLSEYDLSPEDMQVLRMDVEGYEANVLKGLPQILSSPPLLIHMELHPKLMEEKEIKYIRSRLQRVDILCAARGGTAISVDSIDGLLSYPWIEFVGEVTP